VVQVTTKDSSSSPPEGAGAGVPVIGMVNAPTLLAVSGGADSMAMASLAAAAWPSHIAAIASFDHGTGAHAREAVALVSAWAASVGLPVVTGRASGAVGRQTEATWRAARWDFLRRVARDAGATSIATAHTADDQAETVFMRLLRGSGVRGLAALRAPRQGVVRPVLSLGRAELRGWAAAAGVPFLDDPANGDPRHLRVRARHELLPAIQRIDPGFCEWLLMIGTRAAEARASGAALVNELWNVDEQIGAASIPRRVASSLPEAGLGMLWAEAAGRVGVVLDRRGTDRLVAVTSRGRPTGAIPLSGGAVLRAVGGRWELATSVQNGSAIAQ
jgi:tRNA(Ile)-lysidine synthase